MYVIKYRANKEIVVVVVVQVELLNLSSLTWVEMILPLRGRAQTDAALCLLEASCR